MERFIRLLLPRNYIERQRQAGFLFILPAFVYFSLVFLIPMAQSILESFYFQRSDGLSQFAGLRLYERVLTDPLFWSSVRNTVMLLLISLPTTVLLALLIAIGLNKFVSPRWRSLWAVMYFLPFSVSLVAAALVWQWIYDPVYGFANYLLALMGLPQQKWLESLELVLPSLASINVWIRVGFDTMIFLAALQSIPADYYEVANIDGANWKQAFFHITLPLLNPQILMVCILESIYNFQVFDQVYATTQGGPLGASTTIIVLLYETAFKYFRFGEASVMAVFVFVSLLILTLLQWRFLRRPVEY